MVRMHDGALGNEKVQLGFFIFQWPAVEWFLTLKGLPPVS